MLLAPKVALVIHKEITNLEKNIILKRLKKIYVKVFCVEANELVENNYHLLIHYGLNGNYIGYSTLDYFVENSHDVDSSFISNILHYFQTITKKVLLYLGKFPNDKDDLDGGSQLAYQLINTLKMKSILDVAFIRKQNQIFESSNINKVFYYKYKNPNDNKFFRRLINIETNRKVFENHYKYDLIIAAHCSKLFGLGENTDIMNKSVIFPMFLTHSYLRAREEVPQEYTEQEDKILKEVSQIITPSEEEKNDIILEYGISNEKICVIPRGININYIGPKIYKKEVKIVSIGSIKAQKNHLDDLKVLLNLIKYGYNATLTIIGSVYDKYILDELIDFASKNKIDNKVTYKSGLDRIELSKLLASMTIGLSNSSWETFGRGVFECLAAGLPTFVSDKLLTVKKLTK